MQELRRQGQKESPLRVGVEPTSLLRTPPNNFNEIESIEVLYRPATADPVGVQSVGITPLGLV